MSRRKKSRKAKEPTSAREIEAEIGRLRKRLKVLKRQKPPAVEKWNRIARENSERIAKARVWLEQAVELWQPHLPSMPYAAFLATDYWRYIRRHLLTDRGAQCQRCAWQRAPFEIHHLSYEFRGREHEGLHTLEVLCSRCHRKQHPEKN